MPDMKAMARSRGPPRGSLKVGRFQKNRDFWDGTVPPKKINKCLLKRDHFMRIFSEFHRPTIGP